MTWKPKVTQQYTFTTDMTAEEKVRIDELIAKHAYSESWLIGRLLDHWAHEQEFPTEYVGHGHRLQASWMGMNPDIAICTGGPNGDRTYTKVPREVKLWDPNEESA